MVYGVEDDRGVLVLGGEGGVGFRAVEFRVFRVSNPKP